MYVYALFHHDSIITTTRGLIIPAEPPDTTEDSTFSSLEWQMFIAQLVYHPARVSFDQCQSFQYDLLEYRLKRLEALGYDALILPTHPHLSDVDPFQVVVDYHQQHMDNHKNITFHEDVPSF